MLSHPVRDRQIAMLIHHNVATSQTKFIKCTFNSHIGYRAHNNILALVIKYYNILLYFSNNKDPLKTCYVHLCNLWQHFTTTIIRSV